MRERLKKHKIVFISCFILGVVMAVAIPSWATSNTASDPLVSKSWVDAYVTHQFNKVENSLKQLNAAPEGIHVILYINKKDALINNQPVQIDVPPLIKNSRTLVPIRFVGESLGAQVNWQGKNKTATIIKNDTIVTITLNKREATVNGKTVTLDCLPMEQSGRILVPIRFVAESLNCQVKWTGATKRVDINI
ncbi:MAG: copper amine oxidase N-terminal domain-containing protein [Bacillota bacterium]|jgi:hypothetical protein